MESTRCPQSAVPRSQELGPGVAGECLYGIRAVGAKPPGWPCSVIPYG